jgi:hypothetical protein
MMFNKTDIFNGNKFELNIQNLTNDLNDIFNDSDIKITNMLKKLNIKTRTRKITLSDALIYKFKYAQKHNTQKNIINDYKLDNNIFCDNTSFYKKEQKIPLEYYESVYEKVYNIYKKYSKKTHHTIIAVDGTYNNTNYKKDLKLETTLNMGYYDITNNIPLELDPIENKRNSEITSFMKIINEGKLETNNIIFVCDRAYFSYDLMNFLKNKNSKFVIRIKNNSKHLNETDLNESNLKNVKQVPTNTRFINYSFIKEYTKELTNKKTKQKEQYRITEKVNCNIATNLDDIYSDEDIKKIYNSRWNIEEYFKLIKSNFKFSIMNEHNKDTPTTYKKTYTIIKIISILEQIFELMCDNITENYNENYNVKINKSELIKGLFKIIPNIINSNLTHYQLTNFFNIYICLNFTKKDASNPRTSKIPFSKWYVKDYHNKYDLEKILEAYLDKDKNKTSINKNLKSKLKNYTFEKIT